MLNLSLNGNWKFIADSDSKFTFAEINSRFESNNLNEMSIPNNWQICGLNNFSGTVWFKRSFKIQSQNKENNLSVIKFNGVDYFTDVWLNGQYLGHHEGYFQEFYFNVSKCIAFNKTNDLIVRVNSPKEEPEKVWPLKKQLIKGIFNHHDCRPGAWSYEFGQDQNTGGIWNDVELIIDEKLYVENTMITSYLSENLKTAKLNVVINYLSNIDEPQKTIVRFSTSKKQKNKNKFEHEVLINPGKNKLNFVFEIKDPILWWSWDLGQPYLYDLEIEIKKFTSFSKNFAIRKINLDNENRFYLNDKELFLRGTNIIPTQFLSELNSDRIEKIVGLIKEANINIVRVHAHVNRKELYDEFDKMGILLWQDFSLQWTYDESEKFASNAVAQIKEMVEQLYNHPSIAFWCCHNEPGEQIKTLDKFLYDAVQSVDQSRIIRLASNYEEHPYDGWYWGNLEHFAAVPMGPLVTEFGAQALPNKKSIEKFIPKNKLFPPDFNHWKYHDFQPDTNFNIAKIKMGKTIDDFIENSQNYQSELLWKAIHFYRRKKNKGITGIFQFMFIDCWPSITWSVVDYYFEKKKGFYTIQDSYAPILLSINLRQDQYFPNSKLNFDIYIVNDLYTEIKNSHIDILIDDTKIGKIENINIEPNSTYFVNFEKINVQIPNSFSKGEYELKFQLKSKSKIISQNIYGITIVNL